MTKLSCFSAGVLLERRSSGLREPERLRLEEHLSSCNTCRDDADLLSQLNRLTQPAQPVLSAERRQAIVQAALASAATASDAQPSSRRTLALSALPLAALAAAALLWLVSRPADPRGDPSIARSTPPASEPASRVLEGRLEVDGRGLPAGASLPSDRPLIAAQRTRIDTGRARLTLSAGTSVIWQPRQASVQLTRGELSAEVTKDRAHGFHVRTQDFVVTVTGTRFSVDAKSVHVSEGSVQVRDAAGQLLVAALRAGEAWQKPEREPTAIPVEPAAAKLLAPVESQTAPQTAPTKPPVPAKAVASAKSVEPSLQPSGELTSAVLLERARTLLASGKSAQARSTLTQALATRLAPSDRAEALTLRAEAALVAGEYEAAAQGYLEVAEAYRQLPAGENALFAAARLRLAHTGRTQARALFEKYLERYPQGRFSREARGATAQLDER